MYAVKETFYFIISDLELQETISAFIVILVLGMIPNSGNML